jgi:hypothetical protein
MCYSNFKESKICNCSYFRRFIQENLYDFAYDLIRKDPSEVGFHWFLINHPTREDEEIGIKLLIQPNEIILETVRLIHKIQIPAAFLH